MHQKLQTYQFRLHLHVDTLMSINNVTYDDHVYQGEIYFVYF